MKKQILNLGKALSQTEQKIISGGYSSPKECSKYCNSCKAILVNGILEFVCT
ncbi:hypothetical protein [Tenacibaculum sp.]|uniref:hypothetical protein n=1 Tax=Tenacibaculum sp. TaxID=1906242 RepID=UPI003AA9B694